jgi:hypothetical protein
VLQALAKMAQHAMMESTAIVVPVQSATLVLIALQTLTIVF